jgi:two-component system sensor histidine kinase TctE
MTKSLRRTLLFWLLLPMLTLFSIGTVVCYQLALNYSEDAYDRSLQESANDILQLAQESLKSSGRLELPNIAREILLADQYDKNYFSILDEHGTLVAGDGRLLLTATDAENNKGGATFFDTVVNEKEVRAVTIKLEMDLAGQQHLWHIVVGETRNKRKTLAKDILTGFVVPQALIILFAAGLVILGVRRGLSPLEELRESLAHRSHNDMRPLDTPDVPVEVQPLMREINSLLARLESVFDAQKRFTADAAHQLRTPIAGLAAQTDLASTQTNPPQTQHALAQIKIVSARLNQTVSQLLSLARNEPGADKSLRLGPLDLNALGREVTLDWVEQAVECKIDLGFEESSTTAVINGDAPRLREMLDNLIDNALRYCPKGSSVTVTVCNDHCICVEDNGPGIPAEERSRVFERFHRLLGNDAQGSGLGLAIVKEIAEIHGATVEIEQGAGGHGTLFRVNFPAAKLPA